MVNIEPILLLKGNPKVSGRLLGSLLEVFQEIGIIFKMELIGNLFQRMIRSGQLSFDFQYYRVVYYTLCAHIQEFLTSLI